MKVTLLSALIVCSISFGQITAEKIQGERQPGDYLLLSERSSERYHVMKGGYDSFAYYKYPYYDEIPHFYITYIEHISDEGYAHKVNITEGGVNQKSVSLYIRSTSYWNSQVRGLLNIYGKHESCFKAKQ